MLTKSDYNKFLQCLKYLWLNKYRKDLLEAVTEQQQAVFDQGYAVEDYAHKLFPEGIETSKDLFVSEKDTVKLIAKLAPVIYQATAVSDFLGVRRLLLCRADILVYNAKTDSYDIYEVKSSTQQKPEHMPDIAFQKITFQRVGYKIGKTYLIHINNEYVRNGEIIPNDLLKIVDLTEEIDAMIPDVESLIQEAYAILKQKAEPVVRITKQCSTPYPCPFIPYCWDQAKIPEYSVYDITRINEKQLTKLLDLDVLEIKDVPDDFPLSKSQKAQVQVEKTGKAIINRPKIKEALAALKYPLYFFDYETINPAIPLWDGTHPYQQVCFQYSLHILPSPKAQIEHHEYLASGQQNPMPELLKQLRDEVPVKCGTFIVWNKSFEMRRNKEMAATYPQYQELLESINDRIYDLIDIFKDRHYVDPGFHGSASLKSVLPVLLPELSHKNLEDIQEGSLAGLRWLQITFSDLPEKEKAKIHHNLLKYCERDTFAMVKILEEIE